MWCAKDFFQVSLLSFHHVSSGIRFRHQTWPQVLLSTELSHCPPQFPSSGACVGCHFIKFCVRCLYVPQYNFQPQSLGCIFEIIDHHSQYFRTRRDARELTEGPLFTHLSCIKLVIKDYWQSLLSIFLLSPPPTRGLDQSNRTDLKWGRGTTRQLIWTVSRKYHLETALRGQESFQKQNEVMVGIVVVADLWSLHLQSWSSWNNSSLKTA